MTIQNKPVVEIIRQLIIEGLDLPTSYGVSDDGKVIPSVFIRDRKVNYGHTSELQVEIQSIGSTVFYNRSHFENSIENRDIGIRELIQIVMSSEDRSAEERKHELISLLTGQLSLKLQEKWNIKLAVIPDNVNTTSIATGPYSIFRTIITVAAISMKTYTNTAEFIEGVDYDPNVDAIDPNYIIHIDTI